MNERWPAPRMHLEMITLPVHLNIKHWSACVDTHAKCHLWNKKGGTHITPPVSPNPAPPGWLECKDRDSFGLEDASEDFGASGTDGALSVFIRNPIVASANLRSRVLRGIVAICSKVFIATRCLISNCRSCSLRSAERRSAFHAAKDRDFLIVLNQAPSVLGTVLACALLILPKES